jgi:putative transferase (TIGR04331 family)
MVKLITTHDLDSWDLLGEVLFLGPWCNLHTSGKIPDVSATRVLNLHSITAEEKIARARRADGIIERLLPDIGDVLNEIHATKHDDLFWRTCLGYWLSIFVDAVLERWIAAEAVARTGNTFSLEESGLQLIDVIPKTTLSFNFLAQTADWNRIVFEAVFSENKAVTRVSSDTKRAAEGQNKSQERKSFKQSVRLKTNSFINSLGRFNSYSLCTTYLSSKQELLLGLTLRSLPMSWIGQPIDAQNDIDREKISIHKDTDDEFETFVRKIIPTQIPRSFVEHFHAIKKSVKAKRVSKVIFTSNLHLWNDEFSIWSAVQRELGSKLAISQHGGLNGQGLIPTRAEYHEERIADCHLPWGWRTDSSKSQNIPALINVGKKPFKDQSGAEHLLVITDCTYRYGRQPWVSTFENDAYVNNVQQFTHQLPHDIRKHVLVRLHHHSDLYDESHEQGWLNFDPEIHLDGGSKSMDRLRAQSRIAVCTTLGTSEIEQFGRNFPTVLLIDPLTHPIRSECVELFSVMRDVGLLFESPEELAQHIGNIWLDTNNWWNQDHVQRVVSDYLNRFGRQSKQPLREIRKTLKSISAS